MTTLVADVKPERQLDEFESDVLIAYESGELVSVANKDELDELRTAARATGTMDRRVNIRLSSVDVRAIQALALR